MMANQYPDAEIDKLLETFKMSGSFKNDILNGEFIENDIRLSEAIRESIEDIKIVQKAPSNKSGDLDKRKFLQRYCEVAELLGVTFTVEHLLPALLDIVSVTTVLKLYAVQTRLSRRERQGVYKAHIC